MRDYYSQSNKRVIRCIYCLNKLRVPLDKGKLFVKCPMCTKEFIYDPNSILYTLRQIPLYIKAKVQDNRRNRIILFVIALMIVAALALLLIGQSSHGIWPRNTNSV